MKKNMFVFILILILSLIITGCVKEHPCVGSTCISKTTIDSISNQDLSNFSNIKQTITEKSHNLYDGFEKFNVRKHKQWIFILC